ncbi:MAG: FxsA family protein, partial [Candidatus Omnitrophica bacterium]|nr:FxsA family protein [Candidatus Omnitrophota bacterium]
MQYIILAFVITPVVELYLLIKIGVLIGAFNTIMLVVLTGIAGALLARSQGLAVLNKINSDLESGSMPAESLIDGLFILVGG